MVPISVKKFAEMTVKNNRDMKKGELIIALNEALKRKNNGAECICCGSPIWAAGSAIVEMDLCFSCITGEADDSDDYEII